MGRLLVIALFACNLYGQGMLQAINNDVTHSACTVGPIVRLVSAAAGGSANGVDTATDMPGGAINTTCSALLVMFVDADTTVAMCTPGDSKSNTWTPLTAQNRASQRGQFFYAENATVGTGHTFSCNGTATFPAIAVAGYSNAAISSVFDQQNGSAQAAATTELPGAVTPGQNNEIVIAGLGMGNPGQTPTIDSSMSIFQTVQTNVHYGVSLADIIQTTAGTVDLTWTLGSASDVTAVIATFKKAP